MPDLQSQLNEQKRKVDFNTYDMSLKELVSMISDDIINILKFRKCPNDVIKKAKGV